MKHNCLAIERPPKVAESVYKRLADHIVFGYFKPGQRLTEEGLAEVMQVSRTPVREAMVRLEQEGLIDMSSRQGAMVRALGFTESQHVYEVRAVLEGLAARLAAEHITPEKICAINNELRASLEDIKHDDERNLIQHNNRFHDVIVAAAENPLLKKTIHPLRAQINLLRITLWSKAPQRVNQTLKEHEEIYEAIAAGDEKLAERLASDHILHGWEELRSQLCADEQDDIG